MSCYFLNKQVVISNEQTDLDQQQTNIESHFDQDFNQLEINKIPEQQMVTEYFDQQLIYKEISKDKESEVESGNYHFLIKYVLYIYRYTMNEKQLLCNFN